jgi:hypothetical protein
MSTRCSQNPFFVLNITHRHCRLDKASANLLQVVDKEKIEAQNGTMNLPPAW